jgi:hypothetical protein
MANLLVASCLGPIWAALIIGGIASRSSQLRVVGYVIAALDVLILLRQFALLRDFRQLAELSLGVRVTWREFPASEAKYLAWCAARGLIPHAIEP